MLFVIAGCLAGRVRLPRPARPETAGEAAGAELWDGLRIVASTALVRRPMTVAVIDNFLYGYLVVAMVLLAESTLGGARTVGWLNAGLSVGALAAMAVVNRLAAHSRPAPLLFAVMTVFAAATGLVGVSPWVPVTVLLVAVAGAPTLIAEVMSVTLLQRAAPGRPGGQGVRGLRPAQRRRDRPRLAARRPTGRAARPGQRDRAGGPVLRARVGAGDQVDARATGRHSVSTAGRHSVNRHGVDRYSVDRRAAAHRRTA